MKSYYFNLVFILALFLVAPAVLAGGWHNDTNVTNNYYTENNYYTASISQSDLDTIMAAGMAANAVECSVSSRKHQGGVGTGYQSGKNGFAAGYCHSVSNSKDYAATLGVKSAFADGMKPAYSIGYNFAW